MDNIDLRKNPVHRVPFLLEQRSYLRRLRLAQLL